MSQFQDAISALQNGQRAFRAFQQADAAVQVLANYEQVKGELEGQIALRREDLAAAEAAVAAARSTAETIMAHANAQADEIKTTALRDADEVKRAAAAAARNVEAQVASARDVIADLEKQAQAQAEAVAARQAELAAIEMKLDAAKKAAQAVLAG